MLYTFCYSGKDTTSDSGEVLVTIVAESQEEASAFLTTLLASKGKSRLVMYKRSVAPYSKGIVFENIEQARPEPSKAQRNSSR